jgi:hypothetical protein
MLEDRTVPSLLGQFLDSAAPPNQAANQILHDQVAKVDFALEQLNKNPGDGLALELLGKYAVQLQVFATHLNTLNAAFIAQTESSVPFLTSSDIQMLRGLEDQSNQVAAQATSAGNDALASFYAAVFVYFAQGGLGLRPTVPMGTSGSGSSSTGTVSEVINKAPTTYSAANLVGPSESVVVNNQTPNPVTVVVSSSGTDNSSSSRTDVCTNSMITVTDTAPLSAAGTVVTWNVSVTGLADQTNITTFVA